MDDTLKKYRDEINQIDEALNALYKRRLNISRQVGVYKHENQLDILDQAREIEIQNRLKQQYRDDVDLQAYMYLHDAMMRVSRNAQYVHEVMRNGYADRLCGQARVGYQGVVGSFSSLALKKVFENHEHFEYETFQDVFQAVEQGSIEYGVLPLENSIHGEVVQVFDLLRDIDVSIVGEIPQAVSHHLLAIPGACLEDIVEVYSHPQALAQSGYYLQQHPQMKLNAFSNTANSARMVKEKEDKRYAAIASIEAAEVYGLEVLASHIETYTNNQTRFIIIAKNPIVSRKANKTSVLVIVDHRSGSLANIVAQFQYEGVNMLKITSRPLPNQRWHYQFFIDFEGNAFETNVSRLLTRLATETIDFRFLGSYQVYE